MGYFGNGFVLQEEPNWDSLSELPLHLGLAGYVHNKRPVWLLDVWSCTGREHWHFTDEISEEVTLDSQTPEASRQMATFDAICECVRKAESSQVIYGEGALRLTLALSGMVTTPVYYFAGDDEGTDIGAAAKGGVLTQLGMSFGAYQMTLDDGGFTVTPRRFAEDPELSASEVVLAGLRAVPGVRVVEPVLIENGAVLYDNAVRHWPTAAGDPVTMLGVGTWDPFDNVERDYRLLFERPCPVTNRSKPPADRRQPLMNCEFPSLEPARTATRALAYLFGGLMLLVFLMALIMYLRETLR